MPNYVKCKLVFGTDCYEETEKIRNLIKGDNGSAFDFNKVIEMPKTLMVEESSKSNDAARFVKLLTEKYENIKLSDDDNKFIEQAKDHYCTNADKAREFFELGVQVNRNIKEYGYPSWYRWSIDNWGTKWNACEPFWTCENILEFQTAWTFPMPVIKRLAQMIAEQIPDVSIEFFYADEDAGSNTGYGSFYNGEIVSETYPEVGSDDAYETYNECWGEEFSKNENGEWLSCYWEEDYDE